MDGWMARSLYAILAIVSAALVGFHAARGKIFFALYSELLVVWFFAFVILFSTIWKKKLHQDCDKRRGGSR